MQKIVIFYFYSRTRYDNLKKEASDIDVQNRQLNEALDSMIRVQAR